MYLIPNSAKKDSNFQSMNCRSLSVMMVWGMPNLQIIFHVKACTLAIITFASDSASIHLVK